MKRILFLLLLTVSVYGQNPSRFAKIQITGNTNSATATKVNVQEANGEVNTQTINTGFNKNIGLGGSDVVGANTLLNQYSTTPIDWTATAFNSGQVVFYGGKQWIAKMATVAGDVPSVSSKWEEITFESLANKTVIVDQTIIDGSTNAVSGNAVFDGLATKAPISSVHNPVTIGTANGLSLATQQLSLGLASSGITGALSGTDWNTFNGKFNTPTGLTTNYLPKWNGSGFGNSSVFDNGGTDISIINGLYSEFSIKGNQSLENEDGQINFSNQTKRFATISGETESQNNGLFIVRTLRAGALIECLRIIGNGNVGIGTTTITDRLTVNGTISASPATTANQVVVKSQLDAVAARPYKVYTALLSQSSTSNPTVVILENTLGTVTFTRTSIGVYSVNSPGLFTADKTFVIMGAGINANYTNAITLINSSTFYIITKVSSTQSDADSANTKVAFEIRVYN